MTNKNPLLTIIKTKQIARDVYETILEGDISEIKRPGQFIHIKLDGFYLRRPISVCDAKGDKLTIIFKVMGKGTEALARYPAGKSLDCLSGLGNGFDTDIVCKKPLLAGGGVGTPPLFMLAKRLIEKGFKPEVVLGFASGPDVFYEKEFRDLGLSVHITTNDGGCGAAGFVSDKMKELEYDYVFTCGPEPMLRAVYNLTPDGQFSFEERLGCGMGACMCCTCATKYGPKRICKDGPVLFKEEIIWEQRQVISNSEK